RCHLRAADLFYRLAQAYVVWAKIVAPLRDAVGLVDGEEREVDRAQGLDEVRAAEALGRDVDELVEAAPDALYARLLLLESDRAVDEGRGQVARGERVHLVFHQGDE